MRLFVEHNRVIDSVMHLYLLFKLAKCTCALKVILKQEDRKFFTTTCYNS